VLTVPLTFQDPSLAGSGRVPGTGKGREEKREKKRKGWKERDKVPYRHFFPFPDHSVPNDVTVFKL